MMKVHFSVLGEPKGKGRPRFRRQGNYVAAYTPEETASYENLIKMEYRRQCGDIFFQRGTALDMKITAYYTIPKSESKRKRQAMLDRVILPMKKPDVDNLVKVYMDAGNGVIFDDDAQVTSIGVRKFYSDKPMVVVTIESVN